MSELSRSLLGGFALSVGGEELLGISGGSQRLLAFLAMSNRAATRRQVARTLWPESSAGDADDNLRSTLSRLDRQTRKAVRVTVAHLALDEDVFVDVHRLRSLARRLVDSDVPEEEIDLGARAVSALSEDLLPGWYDDWVLIAAENWHQLRLHALEAVAARLTGANRLAEAAAAATAAVWAEPLRESARAALIGVHIARRNLPDAMAELVRYRMLLRSELGICRRWSTTKALRSSSHFNLICTTRPHGWHPRPWTMVRNYPEMSHFRGLAQLIVGWYGD